MEGAEGRPLGDGTWIAESERELKVSLLPTPSRLVTNCCVAELGRWLARTSALF